MTFERGISDRWHGEVPGARWLRADLHVHTLDDLPGKRVSLPPGVEGDPSDPEVLRAYARVFLRSLVRAGVQVVGLTPHGVKSGEGPETSAVWAIVDVWNEEQDDDGTPFRERIYAVFPGFEPNVNDGKSGVHLLFLFDPEIGRERHLALFNAVMNGRAPWDGSDLRITEHDARAIFDTIDARHKEGKAAGTPWDYLVLAPHPQGDHGLLKEVQRQTLETFPCDRLAGYEMGEDKLPDIFDADRKPGRYLLPFMERHRQAFFHGSDAYRVACGDAAPTEGQAGYRTTWFKLASPRIEALRQAFVASESRLRIAYERADDGSLRPSEPPDPLCGTRPWLRRVTVRGEAAFFGGRNDDGPVEVRVDLSPDLTCVIGGSMTGKSTLLDGLRVQTGAEPPSDDRLREDVEARGRGLFLAGQPEVGVDTPGRTELPDRWPPVFFSQNELQRLAQNPRAVEEILARLGREERGAIMERATRLHEMDMALAHATGRIGTLLDQRAEAEQRLVDARDATKALTQFEEAGLPAMQATERLHGAVGDGSTHASEARRQAEEVAAALDRSAIEPEIEAEIGACLERLGLPALDESVSALHATAVDHLRKAVASVSEWSDALERARKALATAVARERRSVEKNLAERGYGAERLAQFQTLSRRAGMLGSYEAAFEELDGDLRREREGFERDLSQRCRLIDEQRQAFDRVIDDVARRFDRIRVRRIPDGVPDMLEAYLQSCGQKGITQWWNRLEPDRRPSPETLFQKLEAGRLDDLGVSATVEARFEEAFTEAKRYGLRALRSPDRYVLELDVGDDDYREASRLSGGRRVSLLLSLLLEAHDDRPLVIDQPEDEIDTRFLWKTVLPALRRLKGRRQVIVATHNADIVVNGDADLVVQLEADADHGRVAVSGAIEDAMVRKAIVETVDGGERAFELRKTKYGF